MPVGKRVDFTPAQMDKILNSKLTNNQLAELYGVSNETIRRIRKGAVDDAHKGREGNQS